MDLCPKCKNNRITEEDEAMNRRIDGVQVCGDCYFTALGDLVEKHPITNPAKQ